MAFYGGGRGGRTGPRHREPHRRKRRQEAERASALVVREDITEQVPSPQPQRKPSRVYDGCQSLAPDSFFLGAVHKCKSHLMGKTSALPSELYSLLVPQSIVGHAQQGHVAFEGSQYPNTTIEDVLEALGRSFKEFWSQRQRHIDDIRVWLDRAVRDPSDPRVSHPVNAQGHYLAGCDLVRSFPKAQDVIDALAGFVYASRMDTYDPWRVRVRERFSTQMGGGRTVPIDLDRLRASGKTLVDLASEEHDDMRELIDQGIVIDEMTLTSRSVTNGYARQRKGLGVSDDAAVIVAGTFRGAPGYVGALWADFVDTVDKNAVEIRPGGQDEELGKFVVRECERNGIDLGLDDDTCVSWIALAAIDPAQHTQWVHCSQRYFYEKSYSDGPRRKRKKNGQYYPAQLHLRFFEELRSAGSFENARKKADGIPSILTSFTRRSNRELYHVFIDRLERFQNEGIVRVY